MKVVGEDELKASWIVTFELPTVERVSYLVQSVSAPVLHGPSKGEALQRG
jgi:hypothetical protein